MQKLLISLSLGAASLTAYALPVMPVSYQVTTDSSTAFFSITFDRAFDPSLGDEFQFWTIDGTAAYYDVLDRAIGTGISISNFMEGEYALARLYSSSAPPVSMVRFTGSFAANGLAQIVNITPFLPGTQDNGSSPEAGGWGAIAGYTDYGVAGTSLSVAVPLSLLEMSGNFTYFFETFQNGAVAIAADGNIAQWLGRTNVAFDPALAIPAITPVPEPSTYALVALGLGVVVAGARRRKAGVTTR